MTRALNRCFVLATLAALVTSCFLPFVPVAATGVRLDAETLALAIGGETVLQATVLPEEATNRTVVWSTGNAAVATVGPDGTVTAVGSGQTEVTVTTDDGAFTDTAGITVSATAEGLTIHRAALTLLVGDTAELFATVTPAESAASDVVWTSDNEAVATVDGNGVVSGVAAGTTVVRAALPNTDLEGQVDISVFATSEGLTLDPSTLSLEAGETGAFSPIATPAGAAPPSVVWTSDDPTIAAVDAAGVVTALGHGATAVAAITEDGEFAASATVTSTVRVNVSASVPEAAESGTVTGAFEVSRAPATGGDLSVVVTITGTADALDYEETLGKSVTIPDGDEAVTVTITPVDDADFEALEELTLALDEPAADAKYALGTLTEATVTIDSDDVRGALVRQQRIEAGGDAFVEGITAIGEAVMDAGHLLFTVDYVERSISTFAIGGDGTLTPLDTFSAVADAEPDLPMAFPHGVAPVTVDGNDYVYVAAVSSSAVVGFAVGDGGELSHVATVSDSDNVDYNLADAYDVVAVESGGNHFIVVAGYNDAGLTVFQVGSDGSLTFRSSVDDDEALLLNGVWRLGSATVGVTPYVLSASFADDAVHAFAVGSDGVLTETGTIADESDIILNQAYDLAVTQINGAHYVGVPFGTGTGGVTILSLSETGALSHVQSVEDTVDTQFAEPETVTFASVLGTNLMIATSTSDQTATSFFMEEDGTVTLAQTTAAEDEDPPLPLSIYVYDSLALTVNEAAVVYVANDSLRELAVMRIE